MPNSNIETAGQCYVPLALVIEKGSWDILLSQSRLSTEDNCNSVTLNDQYRVTYIAGLWDQLRAAYGSDSADS